MEMSWEVVPMKFCCTDTLAMYSEFCLSAGELLAVVARGPWVPFTTLEFEFLKKGKRTKTQRENSSCSYNFKCSQVVFKS